MKTAWLALALLASSAAAAHAQVKNRWRLQWAHEKPQLYTYRSPTDHYENYWYVVFSIENATDEIVPVIVDLMLYTESGKDLQHDVRKTDAPTIKDRLESSRRAEALKFGRFYVNTIEPTVEYKIIEHHARLGNRSPGIVLESVEAFKRGFTADPPAEFKGRWRKGDRLYLNPREMREQRWIHPGQKLGGVAIFKNVDPRAQMYELHVSGLWDIIKITAVTEDEWKMEYEPITMKIRWARPGDEFEIEKDFLERLTQFTKEYVVRKIGPVAAKETIDNLVTTLTETLHKEKGWREENLPPERIAERRAKDGIDIVDCRVMAGIFLLATAMDFGYDGAKDVVANERAVLRIHEWWINNRSKLAFNEVTNRFEVKPDVLPGTLRK